MDRLQAYLKNKFELVYKQKTAYHQFKYFMELDYY